MVVEVQYFFDLEYSENVGSSTFFKVVDLTFSTSSSEDFSFFGKVEVFNLTATIFIYHKVKVEYLVFFFLVDEVITVAMCKY